ncbi:hypothetical protein GALMADRAFT_646428 [Galerina marginata CBS 339.88]|uniref:Pentacotripeptide-repeat region of PRORP domain-containing protein n=1 Tax=Galerina marginata (strain CBS 339.88) TaxID=685588 RepID=A0A067TMF0_GALM3|nr:hypothetical protein GALMADRAFT_646428 [Galerina marginata CBS 339.88]
MLRASSLGLSLPRPTILAVQSCRRLYGARSRWAAPLVRNASNSNSANSPLTAVAHSSPSTPLDTYRQQSPPQDPWEVEYPVAQEKFRVMQHQEDQLVEEVGQEPVFLNALSVSSAGIEEGQIFSGALKTETAGDLEGVSPKDVSIKEGKLQNTTVSHERRDIEESPPYVAERTWPLDTVKPVEITNKTLHFLKSIERGIGLVYQNYEYAMYRQGNWKKKREGMEAWRIKQEARRRKNLRHAQTLPGEAELEREREREQEIERERERDLELEQEQENLPSRELPAALRQHLDILGTTASVDKAWDSYVYLIDTIASHHVIYSRMEHIPYAHLHRFSRLLAHNLPKTHMQYLRLLSVLTYIVHCGGILKQAQWNALINHVASGRRKTTQDDVERALGVFRGMKAGRLPGSSSFRMPNEDGGELLLPEQSPFEPDVYTVTTLLAIAARAMDTATLKSVSLAMSKAGIAPNRVTQLSLMRYFTVKKDLGGVRRTLQKMRQQDLDLGLDGLNACIWAYGNNDRLDIVLMIYRVLRHNKIPEKYLGPDDIHDIVTALQEESIFVPNGIVPDAITYTAVIQTMAYHGHFEPSIKVFIDMLTIENEEPGAPVFSSEAGDLKPAPYTPSVAIYRALFLGFARHGIPPRFDRDPDAADWTLKNLLEIFERFLSLPQTATLTQPVLNIIMSAFARTSADNLDVMRKAWTALDDRFGIVLFKPHLESRLARLKRTLFPGNQSKLG